MKRCHSCECRNLIKNCYLGQLIRGMPTCAGMTIQPALGILQQYLIKKLFDIPNRIACVTFEQNQISQVPNHPIN